MVIYTLTNNVTGDFYIGKTVKTAEQRSITHQRDARSRPNYCPRLYNAMNKYHPENFRVSVVTEHNSEAELNQAEIDTITQLSPAYNIAKGGSGGWIHDQTGNRWKVKDSSRMGQAHKGKKRPEALVRLISGGNNYQSTHTIHTPWGSFDTYREATDAAKELRAKGAKNVVTDVATLQRYCTQELVLNKEGRRTFPEWRGKNTRELGFFRSKK